MLSCLRSALWLVAFFFLWRKKNFLPRLLPSHLKGICSNAGGCVYLYTLFIAAEKVRSFLEKCFFGLSPEAGLENLLWYKGN